MSKAVLIVRLLMGLMFTVFGANGFLHFLPMPEQSGVLGDMFRVYSEMGYMFPLIFGTQLVTGILLLSGRFVPLALAIIAPVIVNIVMLHIFIDPKGLPMALIVLAFELFLAYAYRARYAPMLKPK